MPPVHGLCIVAVGGSRAVAALAILIHSTAAAPAANAAATAADAAADAAASPAVSAGIISLAVRHGYVAAVSAGAGAAAAAADVNG